MLSALPALAEPRVFFATSLGEIVIDLHPDVAPGHVGNFLNYVNDGDYDNSFVHRSVSGFVVQGGAFNYNAPSFGFVPTDPPIANEFALSNVRGTVSMAKLGGDPNSATSQWFINLADNSSILDPQNGGFTVFGTVIEGMDVVDAIAALPIGNLGPPIGSEVPIRNLSSVGDPVVWENHLVLISSATSSPYQIPTLPLAFFGLLALLITLISTKRGR